jgi:hypothetical protein
MEAQLELLYRYQFLMQRAAQYSILAGHRLGAGVGSGATHQVAQELLLDQAVVRVRNLFLPRSSRYRISLCACRTRTTERRS